MTLACLMSFFDSYYRFISDSPRSHTAHTHTLPAYTRTVHRVLTR